MRCTPWLIDAGCPIARRCTIHSLLTLVRAFTIAAQITLRGSLFLRSCNPANDLGVCVGGEGFYEVGGVCLVGVGEGVGGAWRLQTTATDGGDSAVGRGVGVGGSVF